MNDPRSSVGKGEMSIGLRALPIGFEKLIQGDQRSTRGNVLLISDRAGSLQDGTRLPVSKAKVFVGTGRSLMDLGRRMATLDGFQRRYWHLLVDHWEAQCIMDVQAISFCGRLGDLGQYGETTGHRLAAAVLGIYGDGPYQGTIPY